jgi:predicted PurR-regulated permease PerM
MNFKEQYCRYSLIAIIIGVGLILIIYLKSFWGGLLGARAIYIMLRGAMNTLIGKGMKPGLAAVILLTAFVLGVLVPLSLAIWLLVHTIMGMNLDSQVIMQQIKHITNLLEEKTGYDILNTEHLASVAGTLSRIGQAILGGISSFFVNVFVMIFALFFMLKSGKQMETSIQALLPFSESGKKEILSKIHRLVRSNTIGIPLQALIQGLIATLGYFLFGTPLPLIFGFLTCFATVIPIIGTALVWVPLVAYMGLSGDWTHALGLTIYAALVICQTDNVIRFILQKKMADTHPLVTFFGVVTGLSLFGFMGIIFGPLLLSVFLLCIHIFKKEYLEGKDTPK